MADQITRTPWGSVERRTRQEPIATPDRRRPSSLERQIDYLAEQILNMETDMIDPREFGRLETEVKELKDQMVVLSADVKTLLGLANQSRGAIWAGIGIAGAFGGAVSWVISHWK
jgi:hypothetical protein